MISLTLGVEDAPPTEFRLFKKGWNDTEKGRFLFDETAALAVMAARKDWGVDVMIDLEHQSIEVEPGAPDPTARDARGWCQLELRSGDLWAVNVKWTPDGATRLKTRAQRYVSPVFSSDRESKRILRVLNLAITALPATKHTPALIAASARRTPTRTRPSRYEEFETMTITGKVNRGR